MRINELKSTTGISKKWITYFFIPLTIFFSIIFFVLLNQNFATSLILIIFIPVFIAEAFALFFLLQAKLFVEVKNKNVFYQYFPFHFSLKKIPENEIENLELIKINPMIDFLGLGIRYGLLGKGYITSSDKALKVSLKNKKAIYFSVEDVAGKNFQGY